MTITISDDTESMLREKARRENRDLNLVADDVLAEALTWEQLDFAEAVDAIGRGLEDSAAGRTKPLKSLSQKHVTDMGPRFLAEDIAGRSAGVAMAGSTAGGDDIPTFQIEITDVAQAELDAAYLWFLQRDPDLAIQWYEYVLSELRSLSIFPDRHAFAPENERFPEDEIRQLIVQLGRATYRPTYPKIDSVDDGEMDTVRILHVRHDARRLFDEWTDEDSS